ncbi:vitamin K epoxide reductase complex subunit 1 [Sarcoptes scabiei]|nr:vitamin K epoxide reductase complex subunit 1 [Sarcoptes scabiei]
MNHNRFSKNDIDRIDRKISILAFLGILISSYALYVELRLEYDHSYSAMCDLNRSISCTKVLGSNFSKGFGLLPEQISYRNPIVGIAFYSAILSALIFLPTISFVWKSILILSIVANLMTFYLGYLLLFHFRSLCLVCLTTYIINYFLLFFLWKRSKICLTEVNRWKKIN